MKETKTPISFRMHTRIINLISEIAERDEISRADLLEFLVLEHAYSIGMLSSCDKGLHFNDSFYNKLKSKDKK